MLTPNEVSGLIAELEAEVRRLREEKERWEQLADDAWREVERLRKELRTVEDHGYARGWRDGFDAGLADMAARSNPNEPPLADIR
jgi:DNA-binding IclR family transcriptional regulator